MEIINFFASYPWEYYLGLIPSLFLIPFGLYVALKKWPIISFLGWVLTIFSTLLLIALILFRFVGVEFIHEDLTYAILMVPCGFSGFWIVLGMLFKSLSN